MYANKKQSERKSEPAVNDSKQADAQTRILEDNRPDAFAQRKLRQDISATQSQSASKQPDQNGLPSQLKAGIEQLSGYAMDEVKVHYNSNKPAQLQAHAYAQGTHIHLAPGQEKHLPHEAWHVVQQKQGRVRPTILLDNGVAINDHDGLEREADVMGSKANHKAFIDNIYGTFQLKRVQANASPVVQRIAIHELKIGCWYFLKGHEQAAQLDSMEMGNHNEVHLRFFGYDAKYTIADVQTQSHKGAEKDTDEMDLDEEEPDSEAMELDSDEADDGMGGLENTERLRQQAVRMKMLYTYGSLNLAPGSKAASYSGSTVFTVANSQANNPLVDYAFNNSKTGKIGGEAGNSGVVVAWAAKNHIVLPSNSYLGDLIPKVLADNAHAEANVLLKHALLAKDTHISIHELELAMGTNIGHCAECWWAAHKLLGDKFKSTTECSNKIFPHWREPWNGFYKQVGPNPFRMNNGTLRAPFAAAEKQNQLFSAQKLNAAAGGNLYND